MKGWIARHPVIAFGVLAYALTWSAWLPLLAQTQGWLAPRP
jgi:hypothetical protein